MSYVDDLVEKGLITNNLADNYRKGLRGVYAKRLSKGIEVATQTASDNLPAIIQGLISDRMTKSADTKVTSGETTGLSEEKQRALILALWSSRIPKITRDGKIAIEDRAVYGNENYMPPVNLSRIRSASSTNDEPHEPTLTEVLKNFIPKGKL